MAVRKESSTVIGLHCVSIGVWTPPGKITHPNVPIWMPRRSSTPDLVAAPSSSLDLRCLICTDRILEVGSKFHDLYPPYDKRGRNHL
jgi:hypothetical protein